MTFYLFFLNGGVALFLSLYLLRNIFIPLAISQQFHMKCEAFLISQTSRHVCLDLLLLTEKRVHHLSLNEMFAAYNYTTTALTACLCGGCMINFNVSVWSSSECNSKVSFSQKIVLLHQEPWKPNPGPVNRSHSVILLTDRQR